VEFVYFLVHFFFDVDLFIYHFLRQMWSLIQYFVKEEYLMGCSFNTKDDKVKEAENPLGLMHNHAYGILKAVQIDSNLKLVCIRNPWGEREWKGAWSDNSKEWTPALIVCIVFCLFLVCA
jgi:hypothetical protein